MPTVNRGGQTPQGGYHTSDQIKKTHKPEYARDDINQAFAGEQNEGPFGDQKSESKHSTHLKSRKTEKSKSRTPIR